jgi:hypothetical protein
MRDADAPCEASHISGFGRKSQEESFSKWNQGSAGD